MSKKKVNCWKVRKHQSAAKPVDGQIARYRKVQRSSREGVGVKPEALLLRNE